MKTYKVMLHPTNVQQTRLFQFAGAARYAYNWAINQQQANYEEGKPFISEGVLRKQFTEFKHEPGNEWMYTISNDVLKQSIKDCCKAYQRFFKHQAKHPKYKRRKDKQSFYARADSIQFTATHMKTEKLPFKLKLAEPGRIPVGVKYYNSRVTYDGLHWWISVAVETTQKPIVANYTESIGIDLGVKELAVCSNGVVYRNINKTAKVRKLEKKQRRLQRKISRQYEMNKEGKRYKKTCNIIRSENLLRELYQRLSNIRTNYIQQITSEIVCRKPSQIVLEDLNVKGMMRNRHLAKAIQKCCWGLFRQLIEYKAAMLGISLIIADRFYPSSKQCSCCGHIKPDLKLSDRVYVCNSCGLRLDRDLNAAINLKKYGETH